MLCNFLGESVSSGASTPPNSSPCGSRTNSPRGALRGRGRPRGSRGRGGLGRGSPKQVNGTSKPARLNSKQGLTTPNNEVNNVEDSVEPGNTYLCMLESTPFARTPQLCYTYITACADYGALFVYKGSHSNINVFNI